MSRRTVYRYIDTFREAGFVIKKSGNCIRLDKESPHFRDISQLVHFTEEEAGQKRAKLALLLLPLALWAGGITAWKAMNYRYYGRFIVSDFSQGEFADAMAP